MKILMAAAIVGIILGAVLIIFTAVCHRKLPLWSIALFLIVGILIALSGILIFAGAYSG